MDFAPNHISQAVEALPRTAGSRSRIEHAGERSPNGGLAYATQSMPTNGGNQLQGY
jgi:hypothetical protein